MMRCNQSDSCFAGSGDFCFGSGAVSGSRRGNVRSLTSSGRSRADPGPAAVGQALTASAPVPQPLTSRYRAPNQRCSPARYARSNRP